MTLGATKYLPQRELYGRELNRFYAERDARTALFAHVLATLKVTK